MLLIRKHANKTIVQASVERWKRRFLKPPKVTLLRDPISNQWMAKAHVH
jgi:hypothetical protein